jgi:hypothetical protein
VRCGGPEGSSSCHSYVHVEITDFVQSLNSGNFLTFTVLDLLNLAREDG